MENYGIDQLSDISKLKCAINIHFKKNVKITDFTKHLSCIFKGCIGSKHTRAYMCHELNYEKEPIKKLEELIFKEDLWKNGQDLYTKVI